MDALFSILFIVMLAGVQNERQISAEKDEQIARLEQQASVYESRLDSYEMYQEEAVIITLYNTAEDNRHQLKVFEGRQPEELDSVLLGTNRLSYVKQRLTDMISGYTGENRPVYVVFHCDRDQIYRSEYDAITEVLNELQNKEIFWKEGEQDEE